MALSNLLRVLGIQHAGRGALVDRLLGALHVPVVPQRAFRPLPAPHTLRRAHPAGVCRRA